MSTATEPQTAQDIALQAAAAAIEANDRKAIADIIGGEHHDHLVALAHAGDRRWLAFKVLHADGGKALIAAVSATVKQRKAGAAQTAEQKAGAALLAEIESIDSAYAMHLEAQDPPPSNADLANALAHLRRQRATAAAQAKADDTVREIEQDIVPVKAPGAFSDTAQGRYLAVHFKDDLRFVAGLGWLAWDGRRWSESVESTHPAARRIAQDAAQMRLAEAITTGNGPLIKEATRLLDGGHIAAALTMAAPHMQMDADRLDADPMVLCCLNGTLDLRTGELRPHSRDDLITKLAPVEYRPDTKHPALDRLLASFEAATPGAAGFLQRCVGASITGDASTESVVLMTGAGGGGKSTFSDSVGEMLGDYAVKLRIESLIMTKHGRGGGSASPDIYRLRGSRFAWAAESDQAARLDAGVLKQLSGNERVSARRLYQNDVSFRQTWHLWIASNYDLKADSDDSGVWRRLIKVPIPAVPVEQRDPALKEALMHDPDARAALLAWAVVGARQWIAAGRGRAGLAVPQAVAAATQEYRTSCDSISVWFAQAVEDGQLAKSEHAHAPKDAVRRLYENWCTENAVSPALGERFGRWMRAQGFEPGRNRQDGRFVHTWRGLQAWGANDGFG